jgi:hypothetical protein
MGELLDAARDRPTLVQASGLMAFPEYAEHLQEFGPDSAAILVRSKGFQDRLAAWQDQRNMPAIGKALPVNIKWLQKNEPAAYKRISENGVLPGEVEALNNLLPVNGPEGTARRFTQGELSTIGPGSPRLRDRDARGGHREAEGRGHEEGGEGRQAIQRAV